MDGLTIFPAKLNIELTSQENNSIDTIVEGLGDIKEELALTRKGHEAFTWGEYLEGNEEIETEDNG